MAFYRKIYFFFREKNKIISEDLISEVQKSFKWQSITGRVETEEKSAVLGFKIQRRPCLFSLACDPVLPSFDC